MNRPAATALVLFAATAFLYTARGFAPGRVLLPLDLQKDYGAWKADPTKREVVQNRLLSDVLLAFYPWDTAIRERLGNLEFPWTNPYAADGAALFANPETSLFSPFAWPRFLFGARGWALCVFLRILVAGLSMYWLARTVGASRDESLISGLVFSSCGYLILWSLHTHSNVAAIAPAFAAAAMRLFQHLGAMKMDRSPAVGSLGTSSAESDVTSTVCAGCKGLRWHVAIVILFAALITAGGHPETLMHSVVGLAGWICWECYSRAGFKWRPLALLATASAIGFLLLSVQLVPFLASLPDSAVVRERLAARPGPFRAVALMGQILPGFLGTPLAGEIDLSGVLPMSENLIERSGGFVGAITLILLAIAWKDLPPLFRRSLVIGCIALLIAWRLPFLRDLLRVIPLFTLAANERFTFVFAMFASLAAGPALMVVARGPRNRKAAVALLLAGGILIIGGLVPALPFSRKALESVGRWGLQKLQERKYLRQDPSVYEERLGGYIAGSRNTALRRFALPGFFWAVAGMALLFQDSRRKRTLLVLAVAGEMLAFGLGFHPAVRMNEPGPPDAVVDLKTLNPEDVWKFAADNEVFPPNLGTLYRVRDFRAYDVLAPLSSVQMERRAGFDPETGSVRLPISMEARNTFAHAGVRYLLSRSPVPGLRRVGGHHPPAVGVYELWEWRPPPSIPNRAPRGVGAGMVLSSIALVAAALLIWWTGKDEREQTRLKLT